MGKPALKPNQCPACGADNQCAIADSVGRTKDNACWCQNVAVSPAALAALSPEQVNASCLCRNCLSKTPMERVDAR